MADSLVVRLTPRGWAQLGSSKPGDGTPRGSVRNATEPRAMRQALACEGS